MIDALQQIVTHIAAENPIDDMSPNFGVFTDAFDTLWKKIIGALWAGAIIWVIGMLTVNIASMAKAKQGGSPQQMHEARDGVVTSSISLGALAALSVLVGLVLFLFS